MRCSICALAAVVALSSLPGYADEKPPAAKGEITFTIVDERDGNPLADATVTVRRRGDYSDTRPVDAEGRAKVEYDQPTNYLSVLVRGPGRVPTAASWHDRMTPLQLPASLTVRLPKGARFAGRVVDEAGKPVAGAKVLLTGPITGLGQATHWVEPRIWDVPVETDADGRWAWDGVPADKADEIYFRVTHPDFVADGRVQLPKTAELLDATAVITLDRGVDIAGRVTDNTGSPVAGAGVTTVQDAHVVNDYGSTAETGADGRFVLKHLRAARVNVTVTRKGFSPQVERVEVKQGMPEVAVMLEPGKVIRAKVTDPVGRPIPQAIVRVEGWRSGEALSWSGRTDPSGRFEMPDAPADGATFQISAKSFRSILRKHIPAAETDVVVTMRPEPVVRGTVVDAATKKPLEKFRVIEGIALWEARPPFFKWDSRKAFEGGAYQHTFEPHDEVVASYVRVEADGYRPAVAGPVPDAGGEFNFELTRGNDVTGTVTQPDGSPAAGVQVLLAQRGDQVDIISGRMDQTDGVRTKTDDAGHFRFGPQAAAFWLVACTDGGYAVVAGHGDHPRADVKLSPWAKVEGVYRPGGKPLAKQSIMVYPAEIRDPRSDAPRVQWHFSASTDENGHYAADRLPHYDGEVMSLQIGRIDTGLEERRWLPVRLRPGSTTRIDVGGDGAERRSVVGRAVPFSTTDEIPGAQGFVLLTRAFDLPASQWPADIKRAAAMCEPVYRAHLETDGSFVVPDVAPGEYEFAVTGYGTAAWASASGRVTVPAEAGGPVSVGDVRYHRTTGMKLGEPAPADWGRTLDNQPIRLADYAGKFVVVAVWDSCSGRSDKHLPHLDALGDAFGRDDRVRLLSINMDPISCGTIGLPKRPATLKSDVWTRGYLSLSQDVLLSQIGGQKWPAILVVGPDGKLLARDLEGKDVAAKLKELMDAPRR